MTRKLVDPVHVFDHQGLNVLSREHLAQAVDRLEKEVERLTRLLQAQVRRQSETEDQNSTVSRVLH